MRRAILTILALAAILVGPASAGARLVHFKSPSGNINCLGGTPSPSSPAWVSCMVLKETWPHLPTRPKECDVDFYAPEIGLGDRRVSLGSCRGDVGPVCYPGSGRCTTLGYGRSVSIGPIRCRSAANGITCRYVRGKLAGFRIAREGYVVWRT
jgi:hypothetical protein